jgi:glutaredoxin 3
MVTARETAQAYIDNNPVMVFSKSSCHFCKATKDLLEAKQKQFAFTWKVIELDQMGGRTSSLTKLQRYRYTDALAMAEEGEAIQDALVEMNQERTVPRIYIMQESIGGNSDIQKQGPKLDEMLRQVAEAEAEAKADPVRGTDSPNSGSSN